MSEDTRKFAQQAQTQSQSLPESAGAGSGSNPPNNLRYQYKPQPPIQPIDRFKQQVNPIQIEGHFQGDDSLVEPSFYSQPAVPSAPRPLARSKESAPVTSKVLFNGNTGIWHIKKEATVQELPPDYYERMRTPYFPLQPDAQGFLDELNGTLEASALGPEQINVDEVEYAQGIPLELITFAALTNFSRRSPTIDVANLLEIFQLGKWGVVMEGAPRLATKLQQEGKLLWENDTFGKSKAWEITNTFGMGQGSRSFGASRRTAMGIYDNNGLYSLEISSVFNSDITKRAGDFSGTEVGVECRKPIDVPFLGGIVPSEIRVWMGMYCTGKSEQNNDVFEYRIAFEQANSTNGLALRTEFKRGKLGARDGIRMEMVTAL